MLNFENNENKKYILKKYNKINDYQYVKKHSQEFYDFLNNGYIFAGLGPFCGCASATALYKNFNIIKIAYANDIIIAISVYTGYQGGKKCVGITAITDPKLRDLGKDAVIDIIKEDINFMHDFYWTECSGAAEYLYKKYGGVMIPNDYIEMFIGNKFKEKLDDGYHFTVEFSSSDPEITEVYTIKKVIFGFNNKETYEAVKQKLDSEIKRQMDYILNSVNSVKESNYCISRDKYQAAHDIIYIFFDEKCHGVNEFSQEYLDALAESAKTLEDYIKANPNDERNEKFETAIWNAHDILDTSIALEMHESI